MQTCAFCNMTYSPSKEWDHQKEHRTKVVDGGWTTLYRGVDQHRRLFLLASGDDDSDYYYPKFCPECGRQLYGEIEPPKFGQVWLARLSCFKGNSVFETLISIRDVEGDRVRFYDLEAESSARLLNSKRINYFELVRKIKD